MSGMVYDVPAMRRKPIRGIANQIREQLKIKTAKIPIIEILEFALPQILDGYVLDIQDEKDLGENEGLTYPDQNKIILRADVYERALKGYGRDRLTAAHELGHLILHRDLPLARKHGKREDIPAYRSSEWQASCFAGELLMPVNQIAINEGPATLINKFGVSLIAAEYQLNIYQKEGLIKTSEHKKRQPDTLELPL